MKKSEAIKMCKMKAGILHPYSYSFAQCLIQNYVFRVQVLNGTQYLTIISHLIYNLN